MQEERKNGRGSHRKLFGKGGRILVVPGAPGRGRVEGKELLPHPGVTVELFTASAVPRPQKQSRFQSAGQTLSADLPHAPRAPPTSGSLRGWQSSMGKLRKKKEPVEKVRIPQRLCQDPWLPLAVQGYCPARPRL